MGSADRPHFLLPAAADYRLGLLLPPELDPDGDLIGFEVPPDEPELEPVLPLPAARTCTFFASTLGDLPLRVSTSPWISTSLPLFNCLLSPLKARLPISTSSWPVPSETMYSFLLCWLTILPRSFTFWSSLADATADALVISGPFFADVLAPG